MPLETVAAEKAREYARAHYAANREKRLAQQTARRSALTGEAKEHHRAKERSARRKRTYGLSQDQFDTMLAAQDFKCAICASPEPGGKGTWKVDHCHTTQAVRGLLCNGCNVGLGYFKDNTSALRRAASYLEKAECLSKRQLI